MVSERLSVNFVKEGTTNEMTFAKFVPMITRMETTWRKEVVK